METPSLTDRWLLRLFRLLESDDSGKPDPWFVNGLDRSRDSHVNEDNPVAETVKFLNEPTQCRVFRRTWPARALL